MRLNSVTSNLDLLSTIITNTELENDITNLSGEAQKSFGMDVELISISESDDYFLGNIALIIEIHVEEENQGNFTLSFELEGKFRSESAKISKKDFSRLLLVNGGAALYSIARSKVELITGMTFSTGKLNLPFVNMIDFYKDKFSES